MIKRLFSELVSILGAVLTATGSFEHKASPPPITPPALRDRDNGADEALSFMGVSPATDGLSHDQIVQTADAQRTISTTV